jgi:hypothetical protein
MKAKSLWQMILMKRRRNFWIILTEKTKGENFN